MQTAEQRLGPWIVTYEWDLNVSKHGPSRVVIEPADGADWPDLVGGITTSVIRQASPVRPTGGSEHQQRANRLLSYASGAYRPSSEGYLAALANAYAVATAALVPNPTTRLAEVAGKTANTLKAHIAAARRAGLLTSIPNRPGGGLTPKGAEALSVVIKAANAAGVD